ncbi:helix-turn-helix domain-containing protein [Carnobacterium iners]|uniref:helix-turn-helix domain-containing protein n=1 Tax=Carnobacterium iners TaxID=1073423 RepID=UPI0008C26199|nr:helix-turn-helix domain-containing protein [Carnobacterium iners]SEL02842.1 Helix-turn-helix domain of resolvase [Carnobacterium iners]
MTYQVIVSKLKLEGPVKKIAEETGVTRDTVYRIKKEKRNRYLYQGLKKNKSKTCGVKEQLWNDIKNESEIYRGKQVSSL